jgi:hypothetical protein
MVFKASALGQLGDKAPLAVPWKFARFRRLDARLGVREGVESLAALKNMVKRNIIMTDQYALSATCWFRHFRVDLLT